MAKSESRPGGSDFCVAKLKSATRARRRPRGGPGRAAGAGPGKGRRPGKGAARGPKGARRREKTGRGAGENGPGKTGFLYSAWGPGRILNYAKTTLLVNLQFRAKRAKMTLRRGKPREPENRRPRRPLQRP